MNNEQRFLRQIRTHKFQGKRYGVRVTHIQDDRYGECEGPDEVGREMRISPEVKGRKLLQTLIDEAIHQCIWVDRIDNEEVDKLSESISKFLWRAGYRVKEDEKPTE